MDLFKKTFDFPPSVSKLWNGSSSKGPEGKICKNDLIQAKNCQDWNVFVDEKYNNFRKWAIMQQIEKDQAEEDEKFLPSHLLEDDDIPTTTSFRNSRPAERQLAFSAPPMLFSLGYRIEEDFFDEQERLWQPSYLTPQKLAKKQKSSLQSQYYVASSGTRKFSLQNEEEYLSYQSYQSVSVPEVSYPAGYYLEAEILGNLGYVVEWARDQYGSRSIQNALEIGDQFLRDRIFQSLYHELPQLISHKFGNYVIQKYLEIGREQQINTIFTQVKKQFLLLSLHSYGCRIIQKLVEFSANQPTIFNEIINLIQPNALQIIMNQNGNHIIQKYFQVFAGDPTGYLLAVIMKNLQKLSFHAFGCRVLQKYLECGQQEGRTTMMGVLVGLTVQLSQCQYGNYIIQYIVGHCGSYEATLLAIFQQHFFQLSCNKFASNVVQKVLRVAPSSFRDNLALRLSQSIQDLLQLARNQFGNYVIQRLLQTASREPRQLLRSLIRANTQEISKNQYGKHVLMQIEKFK